jgi:glucose/arabinose dehydrogenase
MKPSMTTAMNSGLKGLALHPQFATNRQFFVTYNFRISGAMHARVSRFTAVNGNLDLGDIASEQPFITQPNPSSIHNIDSCRFGPDGCFYWAAGDAGGLNDGNNNAQRIDKDFWGGIFRIDVDRLPAKLRTECARQHRAEWWHRLLTKCLRTTPSSVPRPSTASP